MTTVRTVLASEAPTAEVAHGAGTDAPRPRLLPGLLAAVGIAAIATAVARWIPVVGAPVLAIVLGASIASVRGPSRLLRPGIAFAGRSVLQVAVVVLGAQLSIGQVVTTGLRSVPVLMGTLAACLLLAAVVGRVLGVPSDLRTLIGVGTGICGASAIAAVTPVIDAAGADVAYAISTIFLFNIAAVLTFPILGHALGLGQHAFGVFAGTAVNDMSSVVAAATTYGSTAAHSAVVVKLTRTLMIIPICLGLSARQRRHAAAPQAQRFSARSLVRLVPTFLLGFLVLVAANSVGLIPSWSHHALTDAASGLITVALSAIGLSTNLGGFARTGPRPIVLGAALWVAVCATSLGLQALTGL